MNRQSEIYKVTIIGSITNVLLLILKFAAGFYGRSAAMIADAVHSLSDFITDIIVILFVSLSNKPADDGHDYGHGKYETFATSIIGVILLIIGLSLAYNGIVSVIDFCCGVALSSPDVIALGAAIISIIAKEWIFRITRKVASKVKSEALEANAWHHRSDALSSAGTALGIGGAVILGDSWAVLDSIAAIIVSCFIMTTAIKLIRQAANELLDGSLPPEQEELIKAVAYQDEQIKDIHNLHTRKIGNRIAIEMHLRLPGNMPLSEAHEHASHLEQRLREQFGNSSHIMLHLEPIKS